MIKRIRHTIDEQFWTWTYLTELLISEAETEVIEKETEKSSMLTRSSEPKKVSSNEKKFLGKTTTLTQMDLSTVLALLLGLFHKTQETNIKSMIFSVYRHHAIIITL